MPNWKAIADTIAQGLYGDDWRKARAEEQAMSESSARLGLAKNADSRAAAGEGRAAEENEYRKTRRGHQEQSDAEVLQAAILGNKGKQNELDVFGAAGGAQGAGSRVIESHTIRKNEDERAGKRLGLEQGRFQNEEELQGERVRGAKLGNDFDEGTLMARIDEKNDPMVRDSQLLNSLAQALNAAVRAGDTESAKALKGDFDVLRSELLKKKVVAEAKRDSAARAKAGQSNPFDVFMK